MSFERPGFGPDATHGKEGGVRIPPAETAERFASAGIEKMRRQALDAIRRTYPDIDAGELVFAEERTDEKGNPKAMFFLKPGSNLERESVFEVQTADADASRWTAEAWPVKDRSFEETEKGWMRIEDLRKKA